jgi:hypothetical protein
MLGRFGAQLGQGRVAGAGGAEGVQPLAGHGDAHAGLALMDANAYSEMIAKS